MIQLSLFRFGVCMYDLYWTRLADFAIFICFAIIAGVCLAVSLFFVLFPSQLFKGDEFQCILIGLHLVLTAIFTLHLQIMD